MYVFSICKSLCMCVCIFMHCNVMYVCMYMRNVCVYIMYVIRYNATHCNAMQCNVMQCNVM